jgi:adenosyl cobinamide kinase/adenosyl cobinamide phosphate guanylyltransferase
MGEAILVLGGARSGKSRLAERIASERPPVTYLATARVDATDPEMVARVGRHRAERPADWNTAEEPREVAAVLSQTKEGSVLVDCVTLWVSNLMLGLDGRDAMDDEAILEEVGRASEVVRQGQTRAVWVSNEVGSGGVPANPLARRFNDLQGRVNQKLAEGCDAVHFCVAGLSLRLK